MMSQLLLLVAEDDPDDQFMIQNVVDVACSDDIETHFVENGLQLIEFLRERVQQSIRPKLIMLDLNMPQMDGRQALKKIKTDPKLASIPIVVLTTSQQEEDVRYCQSYGVAGYYSKPSSMSSLHDIFQKLCQEFFV